jgi:sugar transferase EpsL
MPLIKRIFDLVASGLGILVISPLLLILALLVLVFHGTPVLFRQQRPGYKGHPFFICKFRTMSNNKAPDGSFLPDSQRLTRLGRFLRATSLDELPELVNILRGEMSLVGPRPLLMKYLTLYSPEQMRRHDMPPGIAGWAQINGRNTISWDEKFKLDLWYVDHWSFWLDIRILLLTFWKSIKQEGINQPGQATMEEFTGNN